MKFVLLTNVVSPHKTPLAKEIAKIVGEDNFCYIAMRGLTDERLKLGWSESTNGNAWIKSKDSISLAEDADMLLTDIRDFDLFEHRATRGLVTVYESERWFKPVRLFGAYLPGWVRLFSPHYFKMAKRLASLLDGDDRFSYYPIGVWAMKDARLVCRLFGVPREKIGDRMQLWGYFVAPSSARDIKKANGPLKVCWAGRMMKLKRIDTVIDAVSILIAGGHDITLDIIGSGECEAQLRARAAKCLGRVSFMGSVPYAKMRSMMRQYDVYVLSSNGEEGWGAIVGEAMSEGVAVVGALEAGAPPTMLTNGENGFTFHCGDVNALADALVRLENPDVRDKIVRNAHKTIEQFWSPAVGASRVLDRKNTNE